MNKPGFPFWHVAALTAWFGCFAFLALVIWAQLYLGKPVGWNPACMAFYALLMASAALDLDRWVHKRELLRAAAAVNRTFLAVMARDLVNGDRFHAGELKRMRDGQKTYRAIQQRFNAAIRDLRRSAQ
jgi:hypothetical protein